jgi:tetratricopeptide (TPR) repeat protein
MAAVRHACATGAYEFAARLGAHQAAFQFFQARLDDAEHMWQSVIDADRSAGDSTAAAHAELMLVQFMTERGKNAQALAVLQRCVRVFEQSNDRQALALALHWRAYCAEEQGLLEQARRDAKRSIVVARSVQDRNCELSSLRVLGQITTRLDDHVAGLAAGERAVALARELGEPYAEFEALHTLANAHNVAARHTAATELCLQAMEAARNAGYEVGEAYVLGALGDAYHGLGKHDDAINALSRARRIFQARGMQRGNALCLLKIALAYQVVGRHEQAVRQLEESLPIFRALHLSAYERQALGALNGCTVGADGELYSDRDAPLGH